MLERLNEAIKAFKNKGDFISDKKTEKTTGEGREEVFSPVGFGHQSVGSFNLFRQRYINEHFKNEAEKINKYRKMLSAPEISDVIEDAVNECTQEDLEGYVINFKIYDESITKKEQVMKTLNTEFYNLFYNKLNIEENLWEWFYTYLVDGRLYIENVINESKHNDGIINAKLLPGETMDYIYNYKTGKIDLFFQYLKPNIKRPINREEAEKDDNIIVFEPSQINFIPFQYAGNKNSIIGYLEKCKIPYNILKLLETSLVIYRLVRAPERLVFKIDVGNMPRDKGTKFVEKVQRKMNKKEMFDPNTGTLVNTGEILSVLDNYFIPQGENRGSDISTIGGSSGAFQDLSDIHYFHKKLYRSLKYPISRIEKQHTDQSGDILLHGRSMGEITRDEIKWATFLERQQNKFSKMLKKIFLLHLEFKGLKKQYGLNKDNLQISFTPPSDYKEQMKQSVWEQRVNNYTALSREDEWPKSWLMKHMLKMDDDQIKEISEHKKKDKDLGFVGDENAGW